MHAGWEVHLLRTEELLGRDLRGLLEADHSGERVVGEVHCYLFYNRMIFLIQAWPSIERGCGWVRSGAEDSACCGESERPMS